MDDRKAKLSRRDFLRVSALTASGAILAACAPATPAPVEEPGVEEPAATEKEPTAAPPAEEARELNVLFVDWNDAYRTVLENELIPAFQEANPGLTVLPDFTGWGDLDPKVMTAFAGGLAPDVFMADNVEFGPKYYAKGIIAELDALVETAGGTAILDDFYPRSIEEGGKIDGKLVALPYRLDNRGLFYRKDFYEEVGLDPENPPANWAEFRDAAIALTKRTGDTWERAGWHSHTSFTGFQTYVQFLWQNGGSLLNESMDQAAFNSPEGVEAMELWTGLIRDDKVGPVEDMEDVGDLSPFTAGLLAMVYTGDWTLHNIREYAPDVLDSVGVMILGQKVQAGLWYANTYFTTKSDHVDQSWKLLSFLLLDDDSFLKYCEAMGILPPRKSIVEKVSYMTPNHMLLIEDVMDAPGSHTMPAVPFSLEMLQRLDEAIQRSVYGEATPKEAIDQAADEANQIIARYQAEG
jgi:multiple sugar transport system substrate-binding protein